MLSTGNFLAGSAIGFDVTNARSFDGSSLPLAVGLTKTGTGTLRLSKALPDSTGMIAVANGALDLGGFIQQSSGNISFWGAQYRTVH